MFLFMMVMCFCLLSIYMIRSGIKKSITDGILCVFITRSRKLEFACLPEEAGQIKAPPHHRFKEGQDRTYFVNRRFALTGQYPPFMPPWIESLICETGSWGLWEEGDSQPLLPSDEPSFVTPEMIASLINQNVIALIVKRVEEQFGKLKGAFGAFPWYFWVLLALAALGAVAGAWIGLNILNYLQKRDMGLEGMLDIIRIIVV
jgi:hypothetical protein